MITLRQEQFDAMTSAYLQPTVGRWIARLREQWPDRLPDSDELLQASVIGWIEDARVFGINSEKGIWAYVESAARADGVRPSLETRLVGYLEDIYPVQAARCDVTRLVTECLRLSSAHSIVDEEGIAWLASLMIAAPPAASGTWGWLDKLLAQTPGGVEAKLMVVQREMQARGWILEDAP